jgi:hypothetical protein
VRDPQAILISKSNDRESVSSDRETDRDVERGLRVVEGSGGAALAAAGSVLAMLDRIAGHRAADRPRLAVHQQSAPVGADGSLGIEPDCYSVPSDRGAGNIVAVDYLHDTAIDIVERGVDDQPQSVGPNRQIGSPVKANASGQAAQAGRREDDGGIRQDRRGTSQSGED